MSRFKNPRQQKHFGSQGRVNPDFYTSMNSGKKMMSQEPQPQQAIQMASRSTVLTNSFIELSQTRAGTLDCIREDEGNAPQSTSTELFTVSNQQKNRNHSPVSSDCRWGLTDDDESQSGHEDRRMYKRLCLVIGVLCFISIGGLFLTILMLLGFVSSSSGCACSTNNQVPPHSELQKQVKEMNKLEKNMTKLTTMMREQNQEVQRMSILLKNTRKEVEQLKETTEIPVSMTTEQIKPTEPSVRQNTTNMTSGVTPVPPSNTPLIDPMTISLTRLWAVHNESTHQLVQLQFKVRNLSLIPGPSGPPGSNGSRGPPGPLGPSGDQGENGTRGPIGPQGPIGHRGYNGSRGSPGPLGPSGDQGENGTRGAIGPQGPIGHRGYNGSRGSPGERGPLGQQGPIGPQGPKGPEGPRGYNGSRGPPGPPGVAGQKGNPGNTGTRGLQGPQGSQGPAGPPGSRGAGNFSLCTYKRADSTGATSGTRASTSIPVPEPVNRRIIGTVCSTNNAQEYILESQLRPNGQRVYACTCRGLSNHFNTGDRQMFCYMHYWECPLNT